MQSTSLVLHWFPSMVVVFFNCSWNSQAEQLVHIQHFSLLIDNEQAWFNLSAHFACISTNQNDKAYVQIEYTTDENAVINSVRLESDKGLSSFHFKYQIGLIPNEQAQAILMYRIVPSIASHILSSRRKTSNCSKQKSVILQAERTDTFWFQNG
ncbi:unnamed protein product [Rotaria magnacalcarata]